MICSSQNFRFTKHCKLCVKVVMLGSITDSSYSRYLAGLGAVMHATQLAEAKGHSLCCFIFTGLLTNTILYPDLKYPIRYNRKKG